MFTTEYNIEDFREAARRRLPRGLFDYIDRGNEDDVALRHNRSAFAKIKLLPRILAGVGDRDLSAEVLGHRHSLPFGIAPTGPAGYVRYKGEIELARAASRVGVPFILSCAATVPMEEVIRDGSDGAKWFQLYLSGDRLLSMRTIDRAWAAGFKTLVFTVDSIVSPNREFAARSGYTVPPRVRPGIVLDAMLSPKWLVSTWGRYMLNGGLPQMMNYPLPDVGSIGQSAPPLKDDSIDWETLAEVRAAWPGKLVVKGVLNPQDAVACAEAGADAVIVSNHGALLFDSCVSTIDSLGPVVDAVGGRIEVYLDSGIRRGSDIVKALALGAKAVFLGRATLYALAASGESGVVRALELLRDEVDRTLACLGVASISHLSRRHIVAAP
ncbi:alpha-hydroxy acid oxidase [Paraburkholderia sp. RL17-347-BIC-D]|uniref:alpha-hydroxy acid oxidase n=1 Tax=Paraburkholderia sp. RL17-347-BIC-D TaxID=3031632 RepID=UPI0038BC3FEC